MIRALGRRFEAFFRAVTPDPLVLAIGLTALVFALAMALEGASFLDTLRAWQGQGGFWSLLAFAMQMLLILVTGHAVASAPAVRRLLAGLAGLPRTGAQAAALVAAVAIAAGLLNWGLGLIVGALLSREVGRRLAGAGVRAHYPLLVAAGYASMMCWHGGLSGSAPLDVTSDALLTSFLGEELAATLSPIGFDRTVLTVDNLVVSGGLLVLIPLVCALLAPAPDDAVGYDDYVGDAPAPERDVAHDGGLGPSALLLVVPFLVLGVRAASPDVTRALGALGDDALVAALGGLVAIGAVALAYRSRDDGHALTVPERVERHPLTIGVLVFLLAAACVRWQLDVGVAQLDPNAVNLLFLTLGLALHGSLRRYVAAVSEAVRGTTGIVLQFPLYAGIMGIMRGTGLAATLAGALSSLAPASLLTTFTFLSAGLVNLFVPSGGGQWAVQGPIAVEAAQQLHVPVEHVVMAVAYGDQWTNMLQPFWALPLLAITGIKARDILGYTTVFLLIGGAWVIGCLLVQSA